MDGTKRTAFAAAMYFLHERGYPLQRPFLKDDIIRFCVGLAEEGQRLAVGEPIAVQTIRQIADWLKGLVKMLTSEAT
jgi:prophage maintenance system killer protein